MTGQRGRRGAAVALIILGLAGSACSGEKAPEAPAARPAGDVAALSQTWAGSIAKDPAAVKALLAANPQEGWQQLYQRHYVEASQAFAASASPAEAIGRARAELALADIYGSAHALSLQIQAAIEARLAENADRITPGPAAAYFAASRLLQVGDAAGALAKVDAFLAAQPKHPLRDAALALKGAALHGTGDGAGAQKAWDQVKSPDGQALAAAFKLRAGQTAAAPAADGLTALGARARIYALVALGQLEEAAAAEVQLDAQAPDFTEPVTTGGQTVDRKYYDPLFLEALTRRHAELSFKSVGGEGPAVLLARAGKHLGRDLGPGKELGDGPLTADALPVVVFSDWPSAGDVSAETAALRGSSSEAGLIAAFLKKLGPINPEPDQGKQVREAQDLGKAWEDGFAAELGALPEGEGVSMVQGLQLNRGVIAAAQRARAAQLLKAGKALEGLALLEYTFEKDRSSEITWVNSPQLFLDTTRAYVEIGRYREAMNYLYRLLDSYPALWSTYEVLGNLSVLDNLDRLGNDGQ